MRDDFDRFMQKIARTEKKLKKIFMKNSGLDRANGWHAYRSYSWTYRQMVIVHVCNQLDHVSGSGFSPSSARSQDGAEGAVVYQGKGREP